MRAARGPATVAPVVDSDEALVQRTLAGDLRAFETIVERHGALVHRVCARIVGPEAAEDVSQDAFLRAFHRLDQFSGEGAFRSWLLRIAHNAAVTALERRREPARVPDDAEKVLAPIG